MARRWHSFYPQCSEFTGHIPDAPTPLEQRANHLHNYVRARGELPRRNWRPESCSFTRIDGTGTNLHHIGGNIDLDINGQREELAAQYQCDTHSTTPVLWARASAYRRRVQPLIDAHWEARAETITWTGPDMRERVAHVTIWYPRRPAPRTMHTAWQQLAPTP